MMIVADASVVIEAWVDPLGKGEDSRRVLADSTVWVPDLLFPEVSHSLRKFEVAGFLGMSDAFAGLAAVPWHTARFEDYAEILWPLRHDVSLYDACYVALAMVLRAPLVTLDRKLAASARRYCDVTIPGE